MVHFIGAGPGDPELLTIKGKKLIDQADVIIYAGSLVNKEVLAGAKEDAEIYNSATMTLEEVIEVMKKAEAEGKMTARVHTGDPAGVSQTVILTRMEGRTPMPPKEKLRDLAKHNSTMIIFLSVGMIEQLADTLKEEYREDTPVAVVYKASWEDQKIVIGNLTNIAQKVKEAGITKTALTVVGDFLGDEYELSKLYDKTFTHEFRQAKE